MEQEAIVLTSKDKVGDPDFGTRWNEIDSADCTDSCQRFQIKNIILTSLRGDLLMGWPTRALEGLPDSADQPR